ncbi:MAG TPA: D-alanine--D-alanine ligase [Candidatus Aminicenantes bacterium]|nr:D-alanine--D-alanine ligase [Candidatus Aminicenantes bacterium]
MIIGLTYDLKDDYRELGFSDEEVAELDSEATVSGIETALAQNGLDSIRIGHLRHLMGRLLSGERWDLVFNICEGMFGIGREAQVPALLDAFQVPYTFSDPMVLALTLHKGMAKRVVRDAGVPTAPFALVERSEDIDGVDLPFPLFVKPVGEGTGKGITTRSRVENRAELDGVCRELLTAFRQPVLVETFLPGREFTVGIVGTGPEAEAIGGMEVLFAAGGNEIYSYETKRDYEDLVEYRRIPAELVPECHRVALAAWRALGCRDGGRIDLRLDGAGVPNFLEVNPLAGLNPKDSDLPILARLHGISYGELIGRIVASTRRRVGL